MSLKSEDIVRAAEQQHVLPYRFLVLYAQKELHTVNPEATALLMIQDFDAGKNVFDPTLERFVSSR